MSVQALPDSTILGLLEKMHRDVAQSGMEVLKTVADAAWRLAEKERIVAETDRITAETRKIEADRERMKIEIDKLCVEAEGNSKTLGAETDKTKAQTAWAQKM